MKDEIKQNKENMKNITDDMAEMKAEGDEIMEDLRTMKNMFKSELSLEVMVRAAHKISQKKSRVELNNWDDKLHILKSKSKLRRNKIYIDSELTTEERKIQKEIRDSARGSE
ncbi:hypothetical protein ILUMI_14872, partial [Ignelater luminosus]